MVKYYKTNIAWTEKQTGDLVIIYEEALKLRRIWIIICLLSLCICLNACGEQNNSSGGADVSEKSNGQPLEVAEMFFDAFETSDYALMKTYCTEECIDTYFHDGDVNGMVWAKAVKLAEEPEILNENECGVFADVEMETAKTSALYGESETSFYVILKKTDNGSWEISRFATGL